ncbi:YegP family protein [Geomesophilobacter sediminis]|uniref:DUF1508 domain-containing protein n=1 Tax=Geomesophilobacter sediminis TaxID=2798584 RepID=A0A8J7SA10_9BACT|nr:DUF1508 domain-containing protein [Geomesophilobacter sediminis]MBJ6727195.1 DUF1508 domain-containing protein [Geomesophilobacter sediminis]
MVKFEIFQGKDDQYYFRIKSANGEPIAQSEGYARKEGVRDTVNLIKRSAALAEVTESP